MYANLEELAEMIARRDNISVNEAWSAINYATAEMEQALMDGDLTRAEDVLLLELGLEPDYLDLFIY